MNSIFERRSIRCFQNKMVSDDMIGLLLKAAMYAPSAGNEQPWEFVVIRSKKMLESLCNVHPHAKALLSCNVAIAVCGNLSRQKYSAQYWVLDSALAGQNIMLQACELGLGSVWLGVYPCKYRMENIVDLLCLPQNVMPLSIIALGYPAEIIQQPTDRFKNEKIHLESW